MANDAWMVRESERKQLLDNIKSNIMRLEDREADAEYTLARTCLNWVRNQSIKSGDHAVDKFFFGEMLPKIERFSRAEEEKVVMICDILRWLIESITDKFRPLLSAKEIADPQTIFHAESATAQI